MKHILVAIAVALLAACSSGPQPVREVVYVDAPQGAWLNGGPQRSYGGDSYYTTLVYNKGQEAQAPAEQRRESRYQYWREHERHMAMERQERAREQRMNNYRNQQAFQGRQAPAAQPTAQQTRQAPPAPVQQTTQATPAPVQQPTRAAPAPVQKAPPAKQQNNSKSSRNEKA
jgi:hypothetical protein